MKQEQANKADSQLLSVLQLVSRDADDVLGDAGLRCLLTQTARCTLALHSSKRATPAWCISSAPAIFFFPVDLRAIFIPFCFIRCGSSPPPPTPPATLPRSLVGSQMDAIDWETQQLKVFDALKEGNVALNKLHEVMPLDKVEDLLADTAEAIAMEQVSMAETNAVTRTFRHAPHFV